MTSRRVSKIPKLTSSPALPRDNGQNSSTPSGLLKPKATTPLSSPRPTGIGVRSKTLTPLSSPRSTGNAVKPNTTAPLPSPRSTTNAVRINTTAPLSSPRSSGSAVRTKTTTPLPSPRSSTNAVRINTAAPLPSPRPSTNAVRINTAAPLPSPRSTTNAVRTKTTAPSSPRSTRIPVKGKTTTPLPSPRLAGNAVPTKTTASLSSPVSTCNADESAKTAPHCSPRKTSQISTQLPDLESYHVFSYATENEAAKTMEHLELAVNDWMSTAGQKAATYLVDFDQVEEKALNVKSTKSTEKMLHIRSEQSLSQRQQQDSSKADENDTALCDGSEQSFSKRPQELTNDPLVLSSAEEDDRKPEIEMDMTPCNGSEEPLSQRPQELNNVPQEENNNLSTVQENNGMPEIDNGIAPCDDSELHLSHRPQELPNEPLVLSTGEKIHRKPEIEKNMAPCENNEEPHSQRPQELNNESEEENKNWSAVEEESGRIAEVENGIAPCDDRELPLFQCPQELNSKSEEDNNNWSTVEDNNRMAPIENGIVICDDATMIPQCSHASAPDSSEIIQYDYYCSDAWTSPDFDLNACEYSESEDEIIQIPTDTEMDAEEESFFSHELHCNNVASSSKRTKTIFSIDIPLNKVQVEKGPGENGDGHGVHSPQETSKATSSVGIHLDEEFVEIEDTHSDPYVVFNKTLNFHSMERSKEDFSSRLHNISIEEEHEVTVERDSEIGKNWSNTATKGSSFSSNESIKTEELGEGMANPFEGMVKKQVECRAIVSKHLIMQRVSSSVIGEFRKQIPIYNSTQNLYAFKVCCDFCCSPYNLTVSPDIGILEPGTNICVEIRAQNTENSEINEMALNDKIEICIFPANYTHNDPEKLNEFYENLSVTCPSLIHKQKVERIILWDGGNLQRNMDLLNSIPDTQEQKFLKDELREFQKLFPTVSLDEEGLTSASLLRSIKNQLVIANAHLKQTFEEMVFFRNAQLTTFCLCGIILMSYISYVLFGWNDKPLEPVKSVLVEVMQPVAPEEKSVIATILKNVFNIQL